MRSMEWMCGCCDDACGEQSRRAAEEMIHRCCDHAEPWRRFIGGRSRRVAEEKESAEKIEQNVLQKASLQMSKGEVVMPREAG